MSSGTSGLALIALVGSIGGAGGTVVSPAPMRAARSRCEPLRACLVETDSPPTRAEPKRAEATREDDVRVETPSCAAPGRRLGRAAEAAPAMPQVSQ